MTEGQADLDLTRRLRDDVVSRLATAKGEVDKIETLRSLGDLSPTEIAEGEQSIAALTRDASQLLALVPNDPAASAALKEADGLRLRLGS